MKTRLLLILILFSYSFGISQEENALTLISWNIEHFGKTKNMAELERMADLVKHADIVTIQEVVTAPIGSQKVADLAEILNRKGFKWDYVISSKTKDKTPQVNEKYALLWKTSRIKIKRKGELIESLDPMVGREPFRQEFYLNNKVFTVISFHARPKNKGRRKEIKAVSQYLIDSVKTPVILAGDFNIEQGRKVFQKLKWYGFRPSLMGTSTTLRNKCKQDDYLKNKYDNIFYSARIKKQNSDVIDFVKSCEFLKESKFLSNHLPVYLTFTVD